MDLPKAKPGAFAAAIAATELSMAAGGTRRNSQSLPPTPAAAAPAAAAATAKLTTAPGDAHRRSEAGFLPLHLLALLPPLPTARSQLLLPLRQAAPREPHQPHCRLCVGAALPQRLGDGPKGRLVLAPQQAL